MTLIWDLLQKHVILLLDFLWQEGMWSLGGQEYHTDDTQNNLY